MNEGLKHLAVQAQKHQVQFKDTSKVVVTPFFPFVDELIHLLKKYATNTQNCGSWGQFIVISLNNKQISNLYGSWLTYNNKSLETKLISTFLLNTSASKINMFLKLRKLVLKTSPSTIKMLDDIQLQHDDIVGILHTAYQSAQSRKRVSDGIKSLFVSFKIQQAKIFSCVFIEYALSLHQQIYFKQNNEATLANQQKEYGTIPQSILGFSSIGSGKSGQKSQQNISKNSNSSQYISNFQSIIHQQNGLYRKVRSSNVSSQGYKVIDHKFQRSSKDMNYSQQASSMMKPRNEKKFESNLQKKFNQSTGKDFKIYSKEQKIEKPKLNEQGSIVLEKTPQKNNQPPKKPNQNIENSGNSLSYSEKYKQSGFSYDLTPQIKSSQTKNAFSTNNKQHNSFLKKLNEQDSPSNEKQNSNLIKLVKIQDEQQNEGSPFKNEKLGGYQMWKKLNERNQQFINKMLRGDVQRRQQMVKNVEIRDNSIEKQKQQNEENFSSVKQIHDSIVRHSGVDRWKKQS